MPNEQKPNSVNFEEKKMRTDLLLPSKLMIEKQAIEAQQCRRLSSWRWRRQQQRQW